MSRLRGGAKLKVAKNVPLLLGVLGLTQAAFGAPDCPPITELSSGPFSDCEAGLSENPAAKASAECFSKVAKTQRLREEAICRLESRQRQSEAPHWLAYYSAFLHKRLNDPETECSFLTAIDLLHQHGEASAEIRARRSLIDFYLKSERYPKAQREISRAMKLAESSEELKREHHQWLIFYQARLWKSQGKNLGEAYTLLKKLDSEILEHDAILQRNCASTLSSLSYELGRYREAKSHRERQLKLALEKNSLASVANARYNLAVVCLARAQAGECSTTKARELLQAALDAAEHAGDRTNQGRTHHLFGKLLGGDDGYQHLEACMKIARESKDLGLESACHASLAVNRLADSKTQAQARLTEALDIAAASENLWIGAYLGDDRMRVHWQTLDSKAALADSLETLELIEDIRRQQPVFVDRARLISVWGEPYRRLAGYLLRDGRSLRTTSDLETPFRVLERMRGRALVEALESTGTGPLAPKSQATVTLLKVEKSLERHEALLSFQIGNTADVFGAPAGGSWLMVSTSQGTRVYPLPGVERAEIDKQIDSLLELPSGLVARASLEGFADRLLPNVLADLSQDIDHLIIVPDARLHILPFGALRPGPDREPLIDRFALSTVPSAALWIHWRNLESRDETRQPALILADPPALVEKSELPPLPFARKEACSIQNVLGAGSRRWIGRKATESRLKQTRLTDYAVLHFATHAIMDPLRPSQSEIRLALDGATGNDGRLRPEEIASLDCAGQLVVLSACDTAAGEVLPNEGTMSLARPFFKAKARAVIGSLWPLHDQGAAALFEIFYQRLAAGDSVSQALAEAQRLLIRAGAPYQIWGGVAVLGDGAFAPFRGGLKSSGTFRLNRCNFAVWPLLVTLVSIALLVWLLYVVHKGFGNRTAIR